MSQKDHRFHADGSADTINDDSLLHNDDKSADVVNDDSCTENDDGEEIADWDQSTQQRLKAKLIPVPEDYIGGIIAMGEDNALYQVDSVLGSGGFMVVFRMKNLETGTCDMVLKMFREKFDPQIVLRKRYMRALRRLDTDSDLFIEISDRLIQNNPNDETLYFNKATALCINKRFKDALNCYDLAIAAAPEDVLNWVCKAVALVELKQHQAAVEHLAVASQMDLDAVHSFLREAIEQAKVLELGVRARLAQEPEDECAERMLKAYFFTTPCALSG